MGSLQAELSERGSSVMVHTLSPGMVLTGALLLYETLSLHPEPCVT